MGEARPLRLQLGLPGLVRVLARLCRQLCMDLRGVVGQGGQGVLEAPIPPRSVA